MQTFLDRYFWIFFFVAGAWIIGVLSVSSYFDSKRKKPTPSSVLFEEKWVTGSAEGVVFLGFVRKLLHVVVTKKEIIIEMMRFGSAYNRVFRLPGSIQCEDILEVKRAALCFLPAIRITFRRHGEVSFFDLRLKESKRFEKILKNLTRNNRKDSVSS